MQQASSALQNFKFAIPDLIKEFLNPIVDLSLTEDVDPVKVNVAILAALINEKPLIKAKVFKRLEDNQTNIYTITIQAALLDKLNLLSTSNLANLIDKALISYKPATAIRLLIKHIGWERVAATLNSNLYHKILPKDVLLIQKELISYHILLKLEAKTDNSQEKKHLNLNWQQNDKFISEILANHPELKDKIEKLYNNILEIENKANAPSFFSDYFNYLGSTPKIVLDYFFKDPREIDFSEDSQEFIKKYFPIINAILSAKVDNDELSNISRPINIEIKKQEKSLLKSILESSGLKYIYNLLIFNAFSEEFIRNDVELQAKEISDMNDSFIVDAEPKTVIYEYWLRLYI